MKAVRKGKASKTGARNAQTARAASDLSALLRGLMAAGGIRLVDLTQTLSPDFPPIVLPPEMGQCHAFRMEEISRYDDRGPAWYWNNLSFGEHTGTHFDAPIHWISGRDRPNNALDALPIEHFIAPACVIDCSAEAKADADFLLSLRHIAAWEKRHGRIAAGSWVLMRTDWSKKNDPVAYQNLDDTGQHTPGPDPDCVRFLVEERDVLGFGTETIGTDAGQAAHFKPPYPCHFYMHGAGKYGLQCLCNLDRLPATGALIVAAPLKILGGSGSPLRVFAFVPQFGADRGKTQSSR
jgi:kynurenine formamidase